MARRQQQRFKVSITGHPDHPQPHWYEVVAFDAKEAVRDGGFSLLSLSSKIPTTAAANVGEEYLSSIQVSLHVVNLGALPRKKRRKRTAEERAAEAAARQAREEARDAAQREAQERRRLRIEAVRQHIVNQIELAFEKKMKTATEFVTCEHCHKKATQIVLERQPEGTTVFFDQIVGARCADCAKWSKQPFVLCAKVEFFYDGLRQLHINKAA